MLHGYGCNRGLWVPWLRQLHARGVPCQALTLEPVFEGDAYAGTKLREVHKTLRDATVALRNSKMLVDALGQDVIDHYVHTAEWEQFEYDRRVTDWELKRGFERS